MTKLESDRFPPRVKASDMRPGSLWQNEGLNLRLIPRPSLQFRPPKGVRNPSGRITFWTYFSSFVIEGCNGVLYSSPAGPRTSTVPRVATFWFDHRNRSIGNVCETLSRSSNICRVGRLFHGE